MLDILGELWWIYLAAMAAAAWIAFADHPTAANLRRAIIDTLGL